MHPPLTPLHAVHEVCNAKKQKKRQHFDYGFYYVTWTMNMRLISWLWRPLNGNGDGNGDGSMVQIVVNIRKVIMAVARAQMIDRLS